MAASSARNLLFMPANPLTKLRISHFSCRPSYLSFPFSSKQIPKHMVCDRATKCCLSYPEGLDAAADAYPRPSETQWKKELCNTVQLIGIVATPVQINQVSSGKVVGRSRLAVKKSATETSWINLTFWDEMAHVAYQHLEKGQQIYVSGRLVSDTVESDDGKRQTYYKVVVQQLNFVEKNFPSPLALYDGSTNATAYVKKFDDSGTNNKPSAEQLWQAFFANPMEWWDNRRNKKNPKYPDFKHKDTGEALWVEGRYNPPWVKAQLEILDSRMEYVGDQDNGAPRELQFSE